MRPTSLTINGLKCWRDKTLELGQLTAIQGPNGSGKTAIIQAIRLALLGYDPETGKQLDKTRKLVAPDAEKETAEIGLSFDNGFGIRRRFGATTKTQVLPNHGEQNGRECQRRIDEETGGLVVSLDLATFFDLSDEKRRAWLFEHLPAGGTELTWKLFAEWTDAPIEELGDEGTFLGGVVRGLWLHNVETAPNPVVGLGSAIEAARREFLEADKGRLSQREVVDRGAELLRVEAALPPEPVDEDQIREVEERLAGVNQRIGETRAGREARETIEKRIEDAEEKLGRTRGEIEQAEYVRRDVLGMLESAPVANDRNRDEEVELLEIEGDRLQDVLDDVRHQAEAATNAVDRLVARKVEVAERGACPYAELGCDLDPSAMRETMLASVEEVLVPATALLAAKATEKAKSFEALSAARESAARLRLEIRDASDLANRRRDLTQSAETKASVLVELRERAGIHAAAITVAEVELEALGSDDVLAGLYEERDRGEDARTEHRRRVEELTRYSERVDAHAREEGVLEARVGRAAALKELDGNLRRLRAHVIEKMVAPLEGEAQEILYAMDPEKTFRFYFERGNAATLELGFEEEGVVRLFDAASTGERVMLTVAFLAAILAVIAPPMRLLLIDNLEQLDDVRRLRLMAGLAGERDRFDAVIVAGACHFHPGLGPEWDFVDLEAFSAVAADVETHVIAHLDEEGKTVDEEGNILG